MKHIEIDGILIPQPECYRDCFLLAQSDYYKYYKKKASNHEMFLKTFVSPFFKFNFWLRLSQYQPTSFIGKFFSLVIRYFKTRIGRKRCLMISEKMPLGYGLYLAHAFGVIINPKAVIGSNCTISQFTTIGAVTGNPAHIGDNVYLGPSVCVVEEVRVGSNAVVGAGAVVVRDVPEGRTVAGVPAKIISDNNSSLLITNPWTIEK